MIGSFAFHRSGKVCFTVPMDKEIPNPEEIAETVKLFYVKSPKAQEILNQCRRDWEALHGPTDLSLQYTSQAPTEVKDWLLDHQPQLYFDGLPPFMQAFFANLLREALAEKNLDDLPVSLLRAHAQNRKRPKLSGK